MNVHGHTTESGRKVSDTQNYKKVDAVVEKTTNTHENTDFIIETRREYSLV